MMTLTLLAAAQAVADTMAGANPVLTPVASGEPQMNTADESLGYGLQRRLDYDCTGFDVGNCFLYFL